MEIIPDNSHSRHYFTKYKKDKKSLDDFIVFMKSPECDLFFIIKISYLCRDVNLDGFNCIL